MEPEIQTPPILSPSNSGRRRSTDPNSPEFEFWMVRNPSCPQPHLLSADQLFNNGILLPLSLLSATQSDDPPDPEPEPAPELVPEPDSGSGVSTSKRWRDIFKMGEKKSDGKDRNRDKEKKKNERKSGGGGGGGGSVSGGGTELNINIWPFSRSHSAGVGGNRPRTGGVTRKVSSAPCSRSNSAGESKSRKWPNSPSRGGIHLGRSSPVWQVRRNGSGRVAVAVAEPAVRHPDKIVKKESLETRKAKSTTTGNTAASGGGGGKGKVLNLNVPMCIGYRQQLSCRSDESSLLGVGGGGAESGNGAAGSGGVKLFNLRTLFTKKVY